MESLILSFIEGYFDKLIGKYLNIKGKLKNFSSKDI